MEITSKPQSRDYNNQSSPATSPHSNGCTIASNGSPHQIPTPPLTPNPITTTSHHDINPNYPTTFVEADTSSFKHVVQMLTGASETTPPPYSAARAATTAIPPIKSTAQKKQGFKLYERRNSLKNGLMINTCSGFSPRRKHEILSPSLLDFPALVLSPMTPLNEDSFRNAPAAAVAPLLEEEKAIAEKKFYFHPSPRTAAPGNAEPQLLSLFPVTSPRVDEGFSS